MSEVTSTELRAQIDELLKKQPKPERVQWSHQVVDFKQAVSRAKSASKTAALQSALNALKTFYR